MIHSFTSILILLASSLSLAVESPKRIVSLNPALTEVLFAMGLGARVVGTTEFSDEPTEAKKIPRVGSYTAPSIEKILVLKPDLVVTSSEGVDTYTSLIKRAGVRIEIFPSRHLDDYPALLNRLGEIFGSQETAQRLISEWKSNWQTIQDGYMQQPEKSAMVEVDHEPLIVAGGDTFLSEVLKKCRIRNSFSDLKGYPRLNLESLKGRIIDVLIVFIMSSTSENQFQDIKSKWAKNPLTRDKPLLRADPNSLSRLGPRLPKAAELLCSEIREGLRK